MSSEESAFSDEKDTQGPPKYFHVTNMLWGIELSLTLALNHSW
jgi:hypothetical protein